MSATRPASPVWSSRSSEMYGPGIAASAREVLVGRAAADCALERFAARFTRAAQPGMLRLYSVRGFSDIVNMNARSRAFRLPAVRLPRPERLRAPFLRRDGFGKPRARAIQAFDEVRGVRLALGLGVGKLVVWRQPRLGDVLDDIGEKRGREQPPQPPTAALGRPAE